MFEDPMAASGAIYIPTIVFKNFDNFFDLHNLIFSGFLKSQYNKTNQSMRDLGFSQLFSLPSIPITRKIRASLKVWAF
jgi:hypothetical protein